MSVRSNTLEPGRNVCDVNCLCPECGGVIELETNRLECLRCGKHWRQVWNRTPAVAQRASTKVRRQVVKTGNSDRNASPNAKQYCTLGGEDFVLEGDEVDIVLCISLWRDVVRSSRRSRHTTPQGDPFSRSGAPDVPF